MPAFRPEHASACCRLKFSSDCSLQVLRLLAAVARATARGQWTMMPDSGCSGWELYIRHTEPRQRARRERCRPSEVHQVSTRGVQATDVRAFVLKPAACSFNFSLFGTRSSAVAAHAAVDLPRLAWGFAVSPVSAQWSTLGRHPTYRPFSLSSSPVGRRLERTDGACRSMTCGGRSGTGGGLGALPTGSFPSVVPQLCTREYIHRAGALPFSQGRLVNHNSKTDPFSGNTGNPGGSPLPLEAPMRTARGDGDEA